MRLKNLSPVTAKRWPKINGCVLSVAKNSKARNLSENIFSTSIQKMLILWNKKLCFSTITWKIPQGQSFLKILRRKHLPRAPSQHRDDMRNKQSWESSPTLTGTGREVFMKGLAEVGSEQLIWEQIPGILWTTVTLIWVVALISSHRFTYVIVIAVFVILKNG